MGLSSGKESQKSEPQQLYLMERNMLSYSNRLPSVHECTKCKLKTEGREFCKEQWLHQFQQIIESSNSLD